jgi:ATP-dependent RNA helicase DDX55/SPB4
MGRSGSALALLCPHEASYVNFLRLRRVPLCEVESSLSDMALIDGTRGGAAASAVLAAARRESEADRLVMESGTKAFVSYVRAYKEHQCGFIFRLEELPLGALAASLALLRLPFMPEVKKAMRRPGALDGFEPSGVDLDSGEVVFRVLRGLFRLYCPFVLSFVDALVKLNYS